MKTGSKSLLFGVHQFLIHPYYVLKAWILLYGWPKDIRIYIAIFVHDWGYWGCEKMDDKKGKRHPRLGAMIMEKLFGKEWFVLCYLHSRSTAKEMNVKPSKLCYADKYAFCLQPKREYLFFAKLSGEIREYLNQAFEYSKDDRVLNVDYWHAWLYEINRIFVFRQYTPEYGEYNFTVLDNSTINRVKELKELKIKSPFNPLLETIVVRRNYNKDYELDFIINHSSHEIKDNANILKFDYIEYLTPLKVSIEDWGKTNILKLRNDLLTREFKEIL